MTVAAAVATVIADRLEGQIDAVARETRQDGAKERESPRPQRFSRPLTALEVGEAESQASGEASGEGAFGR